MFTPSLLELKAHFSPQTFPPGSWLKNVLLNPLTYIPLNISPVRHARTTLEREFFESTQLVPRERVYIPGKVPSH